MNYRIEHFTKISLPCICRYVNIIKLKIFANSVTLFKLKLISLKNNGWSSRHKA